MESSACVQLHAHAEQWFCNVDRCECRVSVVCCHLETCAGALQCGRVCNVINLCFLSRSSRDTAPPGMVLPACPLQRWHVWYAAHTRSHAHRAVNRKAASHRFEHGAQVCMCMPAQRPRISCAPLCGSLVGISGARSISVVATQAELAAECDEVCRGRARLRSARVISLPLWSRLAPGAHELAVHGQMIA